MNRYSTPVVFEKHHLERIDFNSKLMFVGSCFAENIGSKFKQMKFSSVINPYGVVYNPLSLATGIDRIILKKEVRESDLFLQNGLYKSFDFHSQYSYASAEESLEAMNNSIANAHEQLKSAHKLFITFGTSWVYQLVETGAIVTNCHKHNSNIFLRKRLTVSKIVSIWNELLIKLTEFNPKLKIIFTVSPIRHWKDGAHGNQLSKSVLLLAIDELLQSNAHCHYFPAYEIVMDELRDYRFYADDMLHLSEVAIAHIWEKVQREFIADCCYEEIRKIIKLNNALHHRPLNTDSSELQKFASTQLALIEELELKQSTLDFSIEKQHFNKIITNQLD
ncbi:MAG: GSCFA domain-containing protein [Mangrovibacterium sp.]